MRTKIPKEFEDAPFTAQFPHNFSSVRKRALKFPVAVKHRHAKIRIYKKSAKYPFYRIAYHAERRRVVRSFKTYGKVKREADRIVRQIANGNEAAASFSTKDALA